MAGLEKELARIVGVSERDATVEQALQDFLDERDQWYKKIESGANPMEELVHASDALLQYLINTSQTPK